jgi:capsular polysaccharide transport system permease protein
MKNPLWAVEKAGKYVGDFFRRYLKAPYFTIIQILFTHRLITVLIILPWLTFASYKLFIQTPLYVSTASFVIEREISASANQFNRGIFSYINESNPSQTYLTQTYLRSREMLSHLEANYHIKAHFQSNEIDTLSRLKKNPSEKDFLSYFQDKIAINIDNKTNELRLSISAFSPETARYLTRKIIEETKIFINHISHSMADKEFIFAKKQLETAKKSLHSFKNKVLVWQNKHGLLDPKESLKVMNEVLAKLQKSLVDKQTELISFSSFMQPNASKLVALKEEIDALKNQIQKQTNALLSNSKGEGHLNKILTDYEWLKLQLNIANTDYQSAQNAYHEAALQQAKQQNTLIEIETPNLPDEYEYPQKWYELINALILLIVLFLLIKMSINIIEEHLD